MSAYLPFDMAAFFVLGDYKLVIDFLFQLSHVADDAYELVAAGEAFQHPDSLASGVVVQGAEAFIYEHNVQIDGGGIGLNLVGEAQGQGKGCHKGFASGKGADIPFLASDGGVDHQVQASVPALPGIIDVDEP